MSGERNTQDSEDVPADGLDDGPAGTDCAICGIDISPNQYWSCRAILVDESGAGGEKEAVKMVCRECWADLDSELSASSE